MNRLLVASTGLQKHGLPLMTLDTAYPIIDLCIYSYRRKQFGLFPEGTDQGGSAAHAGGGHGVRSGSVARRCVKGGVKTSQWGGSKSRPVRWSEKMLVCGGEELSDWCYHHIKVSQKPTTITRTKGRHP